MSGGNRRAHIDVLRFAAIFLVLYNHSGERGFLRFSVTQGAASWAYLCFAVLDKIAVPLFLMISGALLLAKNEPIGVYSACLCWIACAVLLGCGVTGLWRIASIQVCRIIKK